ncbi:MAG: hypothetical protein JWN56_1491 [Sphingobacteriales bacterium]|nr:hypothetical protein [Sphingobacteriales bacterium]
MIFIHFNLLPNYEGLFGKKIAIDSYFISPMVCLSLTGKTSSNSNYLAIHHKLKKNNALTDEEEEIYPLLGKILIGLVLASLLILLVLIFSVEKNSKGTAFITFLSVGGAYLVSGIVLDFLFGMPRSERFKQGLGFVVV